MARLKTGADYRELISEPCARRVFRPTAVSAQSPTRVPSRHRFAPYAGASRGLRSRYVGGVMEEQHGTYRRQFLARSFKMTALLALESVSMIRRALAFSDGAVRN